MTDLIATTPEVELQAKLDNIRGVVDHLDKQYGCPYKSPEIRQAIVLTAIHDLRRILAGTS